MVNLLKIGKAVFVILVIVIAVDLVLGKSYSANAQFGITFSPRYARYLGLDWHKTYVQILDDLKVKNLRLTGYWDILEPQPGKYDFSETDFLINEAGKRGAKIILVLGARQPRWPECHVPAWAQKLSIADRQQKILEFAGKTAARYQNRTGIVAWQVENEPFAFWFGEGCDPPDQNFLQQEIQLVRQLDPQRLIMITDSGEWSSWVTSMKLADILGTSLYRKSYNQALNLYFNYPFPAWMYGVKARLVKSLFAPQNQGVIISELQTEPWLQKAVTDAPLPEQIKLFSVQNFKDNIEYAKKTGFEEDYLWGAEWWYYMKAHGHPEYLDYAATLFR